LDTEGHDTAGLQCGDWKLVREDSGGTRTELFDLGRDPAEAHDLTALLPKRAGYLLSLLWANEREEVRPSHVKAEPDPALRERLRALGYVQ
jgi:hypothetical protein